MSDNHQFVGVRFVDEMLLLASDVGQIKCEQVNDRRLRFQIPDQPACEVELERAKAKLRMLCARLGVLCNESGQDVSLYGGEGTLRKACQDRTIETGRSRVSATQD